MSRPLWPEFSIGPYGGVPTLHEAAVPDLGWAVAKPYLPPHYEVFATGSRMGLRHLQVDATFAEDIYHPELRFWQGPDTFDGSAQDTHFRAAAEAAGGEIWLQLRLYAGAPEWWTVANPAECQVYADGTDVIELQRAGVRRLPSLASERWRRESCEALARYLDWLVDSGWSSRVSMILVSGGITWEWGILGTDGLPDYSLPAQSYFRCFLRDRYGTEAALATAWGRQETFENAEIPDASRRWRAGGDCGLREVPAEQDVIDHQQSLSEMNSGLLLAYAETIKAHTARRVVVGAFYGYTLSAREQNAFTSCYGPGGFLGGHHALGRVLASPDIDLLAAPFAYANRTLGSGLIIEPVPLASCHLHGKAYYDENDCYTHSGAPVSDDREFSAGGLSIGNAASLAESLQTLQLAWAQALVRGKHTWFIELSGWIDKYKPNYGDPEFQAEVQRLNAIGNGLLASFDRASVTEVAFVLDEASVGFVTLDNKRFRDDVYLASIGWAHHGVPLDVILLDDLLTAPEPGYRIVVPAWVKSPPALSSFDSWCSLNPGVVVQSDPNPDLSAMIVTAGVHRYVQTPDTVWANRSMVLVHANGRGDRCVCFRQPCSGRELIAGSVFDAPGGEFTWHGKNGDTALFLIEQIFAG